MAHRLVIMNLGSVLNAAAQMISAAQYLYSNSGGYLTDDIVDGLSALQSDMIRYLAHFEDGKGYGSIGPDALVAMRNYEQIATDLLSDVKE